MVLMKNYANDILKDIDGDRAESFALQNKHSEVAEYIANFSNN